MSKQLTTFVAYPSDPKEVGDCIDKVSRRLSGRLAMTLWKQNDIAGRPLVAPIFEGLSTNDILIADVTSLNFNVTYEIGYAIGISKRAFLIKHTGMEDQADLVRKVGIFDTLGYESYEDSDELFEKLSYPIDAKPININPILDRKAPLYVLETPVKTEGMGYIVARVKKARIHYRSFTPSENTRLSAMEAIQHVANSHGVLIPLLPNNIKDSEIHNIRAAFVAGLSHGMQKSTLIMQSGGEPVPLDIRDFVKSWTHHKEVDKYVEDLARDVVENLQATSNLELPVADLLTSMSFGDPMAENEFQTLGQYFVETDDYQRTVRGEVNLVVGRKGTGKTALFSQVRDRIRRDKQNIVVDLKPEGYQLVKLKEDVLVFLDLGAKTHLVTAFWEYLLYLEVCHKVLHKDREVHLRNHHLTEPYRKLHASYFLELDSSEGDFSERLHNLSDRIGTMYNSSHGGNTDTRLTSGEVTNLVHKNDISELRDRLSTYLEFKKGVWILFDGIDKGWSAHGLTSDDISLVRGLIDAGRKIQREMRRSGHDFHCIIFLRNDVYQLLMDESSDFGKEMRASLDWDDPDLLREMVRMRMAVNDKIPDDVSFDSVWGEICVSHIDGTESSQYMIERSLMRPRNLLKIIAHCRGSAVNLHHGNIEEGDIRKGLAGYSIDLLIDIDQELTDIDSRAAGLVYVFRKERHQMSRDDVDIFCDIKGIPSSDVNRIVSFLIYYGFFGLCVGDDDPQYIHDVGYDMKMMDVTIQKHAAALRYEINPAFWPALSITN